VQQVQDGSGKTVLDDHGPERGAQNLQSLQQGDYELRLIETKA
jgi:hypothetical protein